MIAFHFPPAAMGSGHLRTLAFARYLPEHGWNPIVLSARALAYPRTAPIADGVIPPGCAVHRSLAFDAGRHFAIAGKYPGFIAQPDRWVSWWPAAVWEGLRLIRRHKVQAIWSTYPIMTAHCIAHALARHSGLPWIADFRDPVATSVSQANRFAVASQRRWEQRVLQDAARITFTTPGAQRDYVERYPDTQARLAVVENGYDEAAFVDLPTYQPLTGQRPVVLLHSGLLYPEGRNPVPFFDALARIKQSGEFGANAVRVVLRASGSESAYMREIEQRHLDHCITLAPPVSNREALAEQMQADGLLLFQGRRFNRQIPAKVYEYLRAGRPIFALTDMHGDTADILRKAGSATLVPIDDVDAITVGLRAFICTLSDPSPSVAQPAAVMKYSRRAGAATLACMLNDIAAAGERRIAPGAMATPKCRGEHCDPSACDGESTRLEDTNG